MCAGIKKLRESTAYRQNWLCHYCGLPMSGMGSPYHLQFSSAGIHFHATAEHLLARKDGGTDKVENIVAAHAVCNRRRHKRYKPLDIKELRDLVRKRLADGRWFDARCLKLLNEAKETKAVEIKMPRAPRDSR